MPHRPQHLTIARDHDGRRCARDRGLLDDARRVPGDAALDALAWRGAACGGQQTGSFGAGLSRHLALAGVPVLEVTGPEPAGRRSKGKDDELDAVAAARAALSGQRVQVAKDRSGAVEALRVLRTTRSSAVKCRRAALQQLRNTVLAAQDEGREPLRYVTRMQLIRK